MSSVQLKVEGIHCIRCVQKINNCLNKEKEIIDSNVNLDYGLIDLELNNDEPIITQNIAKKIEGLGFKTSILTSDETSKNTELKLKARSSLLRLAIIGALTGNIMLLSFSDYFASEENEIINYMRLISAALFIPVLFYGAFPIYKNSWISLINKKVSIDLPIALAIIVSAFFSYYNFLVSGENVYFDSLSMFIFFILGSRFLVFKIQQRYLSPILQADIIRQTEILKKVKGNWVLTKLENIQSDDRLLIKKNEYIPIDGVLLSKETIINSSTLSGESTPYLLKEYDKVYAGHKNLGGDIEVMSSCDYKETRLASLLKKINKSLSNDTEKTTLVDKGAQWLVVGIFVLAILFVFFNYHLDSQELIARLLALFVVACPCAIAIITPLAQRLSIKYGIKKDILFKNPTVVEKLNDCESFIFDKTGTLTLSSEHFAKWSPRMPLIEEASIILAMEKRSDHSLSAPIIRSLPKGLKEVIINKFNEVSGKGIECEYNGHFYEIKKSEKSNGSGFFKDGLEVLNVEVDKELREDAKNIIQKLKNSNRKIYLMSGDSEKNSNEIAIELNIPKEQVFSDCTPQSKALITKRIKEMGFEKVAFIGDGINDSLAMLESDIAISVNSCTETSFQSSDIHFLKNDMNLLLEAIQISNSVNEIIYFNLFLSLVYNVAFATLALMGMIGPLVAVVLMPSSTLFMLVITLIFFNRKFES